MEHATDARAVYRLVGEWWRLWCIDDIVGQPRLANCPPCYTVVMAIRVRQIDTSAVRE